MHFSMASNDFVDFTLREPDPVDPLSSELLLENDRLKDQVTATV